MWARVAVPLQEPAMNETDSREKPTESVLAESTRLREENARLRRLLAEHGIPIPPAASSNEAPSRAQEKLSKPTLTDKASQRIALFRSLFRGREDVYAVRWEQTNGRVGYAPRADRDWRAYFEAKESDRKKVDRKTRKFRPLTDDVVRRHLMGEHTVGIYPLLLDETCWFLAVDFDKSTWQQDAGAFLDTCREVGVPAALERSRSGDGGHVWIFFDRPIPAVTARKLGCLVLTRTMERRHQVGLDSYDRFFPNQDTMPKGGFGNLIALPLQKNPRKIGNSVFVDAEFRPYRDQWAFLSTLQRMSTDATGELVAAAQSTGDLIGSVVGRDETEMHETLGTCLPSRNRRERPIEESPS